MSLHLRRSVMKDDMDPFMMYIDIVLLYSGNDGSRKCVSVTIDYGNF